MYLVQTVNDNFPGMETEEALDEHRKTVPDFMNRQEAICVMQEDEIAGVLLFSRENNMFCILAVDPIFRRQHKRWLMYHVYEKCSIQPNCKYPGYRLFSLCDLDIIQHFLRK